MTKSYICTSDSFCIIKHINMPETLTDRNRCHKCDKTGKRKKDKLSKCGRCEAITYCSRECQVEDWPRHKENCIPVMVKEYEGKGLGLVAAKDIKMAELILIDKAQVTDKDINCYGLNPEVERMLLNQKILKDIALMNHSCAANAEMGLLDGEKSKDPEKRFELRAVKNITKGDEVTIHYPSKWYCRPHAFIRVSIQEDFGFNCKCVVCMGKVPNQDDIFTKFCQTLADNQDVAIRLDDEKTLLEWKREAVVFGIMSFFLKPVYMGKEIEKLRWLFMLHNAAMMSGNSDLMVKALDDMKELADKTGLEMVKNAVEMWNAVD